MNIKKVIIPAAGLGTRFLPFTKAVPKEMLPIGNLPAIHYILKEIVDSGIEQVIIIVSQYKQAIKDYLSPTGGTIKQIEQSGKAHLLNEVNQLINALEIVYVEQKTARGLGDALYQVADLCDTEYIGVILPDDLIDNHKPALLQLKEIAQQTNGSVIAVQKVKPEAISAYGCVSIESALFPKVFPINHLVEKPKVEHAPSDLAIVGRYILSPSLFKHLAHLYTKPQTGEIQLTDALLAMLEHKEKLYAYEFEGQRFDLGTPVGWLEANNRLTIQSAIPKTSAEKTITL